MKNKNDLPSDTPIYRFIKLRHLLKSVRKKEFAFNSIKSWDDGTETFIECLPMFKLGRVGSNTVAYLHPDSSKRIYGSCWTYNGNSSARWDADCRFYDKDRITSRDFDFDNVRVCMVSTVGELKSLLRGKQSGYGKITYLSDNAFLHYAKKMSDELRIRQKTQKWFSPYIDILLHKRKAFSYEEEYRGIIISQEANQSVLEIPYEPDQFIKKIWLHPYFSFHFLYRMDSSFEWSCDDKDYARKLLEYYQEIKNKIGNAFTDKKLNTPPIELTQIYGRYLSKEVHKLLGV